MSNLSANEREHFDRLFPEGHDLVVEGLFLQGTAMLAGKELRVVGTRDHAAIDTLLALKIAEAVLRTVEADAEKPPRPIVFIADTQGQALSRHEELLGLNGYFAHVARCVDLARRRGHRLLTLVQGEAVSGGFLAFGLLADRVCALPGAQVRVMDLRAMSRVTKIPFEQLEALAVDSPVFAPGAENYWRMGGIHEMWNAGDDWRARMIAALESETGSDDRAALGAERGGRYLAQPVAALVMGS